MTIALVTSNVWKEITAAARRAPNRSAAAVAYFGSGASKLLPLRRGSRLVVDASEAAVGSGQTNPAELSRLLRRGVRIYSVPNLHSKVFVFGREAFIGSANASSHSATSLVEAVVRTSERATVKAARWFVTELCVHELGPEAIKRLGALYRPPKFVRGRRRRVTGRVVRPELPRLLLAQLKPDDPPEASEATQEEGRKVAMSRRKHRRAHSLDEFFIAGRCRYNRGDSVIQILTEGSMSPLVFPPGNVVHTRRWSDGRRQVTFVYLEIPKRRRVRLTRFASRLGRGARKKLKRHGLVREYAFQRQLLSAWQR